MKIQATLLLGLMLMSGAARADALEDFLSHVNAQARVDYPGFSATVSSQFGVPSVRVRAVFDSVGDAGDAFLVFQIGAWTGLPPERVVEVYRENKGRGWGVIAKQLGIKPGSARFHKLKRGELQYGGKAQFSGGHDEDESDKGHGKGHGKNKHKKKDD